MRHLTSVLACLVCALVIGALSPAFAGLRTLDFEEYEVVGYNGPPQGFYYANIISGGARLSPRCHIHVMSPGSGGFNDSAWIAWDASGCGSGGISNPDFLGDSSTTADFLYLDFFGQPFTLKSFYAVNSGFHVLSSNGGERESSSASLPEFEGPEWTDITWLLFECQLCGAPTRGIDHLTVDIPAPGSLPLVAAGTVLGFLVRRRLLQDAGA